MLKIHFLNVGHGDCTFIELPATGNMAERLMMIDINNCTALEGDAALPAGLEVTNSLQNYLLMGKSFEDYYRSLLVDPYEYYRDNLMEKYPSVFRYLQTHPDMDHMSGLHRFFWQEKVPLWNFWDVAHTKTKSEADFANSGYSYNDWLVYQELRRGRGPGSSTHNAHSRHRGLRGSFWTEDNIEILSPTPQLVKDCNENGVSWNNASQVFKISHGGRSVILAGDAEAAAWDSMLESVPHHMPCDVLKAAHHGRESGHHADALDVMDPDHVICSVGKKSKIPDASPLYRKQGASVYSTRAMGTITVTMWADGELWINAGAKRLATMPPLKAPLYNYETLADALRGVR